MTRAWTSICVACLVRNGRIFLMLYRMNLQDLAVAEMWSVKVKPSSRITPRFLAVLVGMSVKLKMVLLHPDRDV
ncbi:hypothetical protein AMELA_G00243830 [Ameiurus melas]|uniref:Uncharacterized protein n=1 Tax=Ameiurus melas TaxID=219545 RepID=A0A7J5ZSJ2_AMEME|nr:hypothetical protein AMELA_G00243830 [Ameiurus melas]